MTAPAMDPLEQATASTLEVRLPAWRQDGFDWVAFFLLLVLMRISTWSLTAADWTDHLALVGTVASLGVVFGAWFGWSRFSGRLAALAGVGYGVVFSVWLAGLHVESSLLWWERVQELGRRLWIFLSAVVGGKPNEDGLMFVLLLALLFWGLGMSSGYRLIRRRSVAGAILPSAAALVLNAYIFLGEPDLRGYVAWFALFALFLAARMELRRRQAIWRGIEARVASDVFFPILTAGLLAAGALVFAAWAGPAFAQSEPASEIWSTVTRPWLDLRERLGDSLRGLRSPAAYVYEAYGDDLTLKAGVELEEELVMRISAARLGEDQGRYYWRAKVYSRYEGGKWFAPQAETLPVYPLQPDLVLSDSLGRELMEVGIEPRLPGLHTLYVLAQPVWVSRQSEFAVRRAAGQIQDVSAVSVPGVVVAGESYRVRALHAEPLAEALRAAAGPYPDWVTREYLQVPPEITDRTRALAQRITQGEENAYDKAQAVTRWLRQNMQYSRVTDEPPQDAEPLDWFLFDYQTGFCEWDASAAVILLRAAGVPARMAAGYAQGTPRQDAGNLQELAESDAYYEVYGTDLHTWPEVYFPGYGWIEFEPTGGQPELVRPEGAAGFAGVSGLTSETPTPEAAGEAPGEAEQNLPEAAALPEANPELRWVRQALTALAALGGVVLLLAAWLRADPLAWTQAVRGVSRGMRRVGLNPPERLARLAPEDLTPAAEIYRRWSRWLARLGVRPSPAMTAHERAGLFAARHPELGAAGWSLVEAYAAERYGSQPADDRGLRRLWHWLEVQILMRWITGGGNR